MTLRIFQEPREGEDVVSLHGWLSVAEVPELDRTAAAHAGRLRIDLTQLAGIDADGLQALVRLRAGGVRLTGASPLVELLLRHAEPRGPGNTGTAMPVTEE
jgi:anti-anti-sigma regulatory factor